MATHASRDTTTGLLFEQLVQGKAQGIPLHKKELGKYFTQKTGKYYSLTSIRPSAKVPRDYEERAKMFEGKYLLTKALEPDEAYLDVETSTLTIFEKKFQSAEGSADEKMQTCGFKLQQYKKIAAELGIENVYYIYIFSEHFKDLRYKDALDYIKSVDGCDYFFM
jgi:hypothetical protein